MPGRPTSAHAVEWAQALRTDGVDTTALRPAAATGAVRVIAARGTLRDSLRVDGMLLRPFVGAVTALPVVVVFALGLTFATPRVAIAMALGANLIAVVSLIGAPRLSLRLALVDAAAMGLSVFAGSATGPYPWLHALVLVPWCFATGMLVAFGQAQATVGTQAIIAFLVIGRFSLTPVASVHIALLVVLGALIEITALVVLRLPPSLHYQRSRLADSLVALAELAVRDPRLATVDVSATLDDAERALSAPSLFGRTDARELRAALDQARRIRLELSTIAGLRARLSTEGNFRAEAAIDGCLDRAAAALTAIAGALRRPREPGTWLPAATAYGESVARLEAGLAGDEPARDLGATHGMASLNAIGGQIRAAGNLVETAGSSGQRHLWRPNIAVPRIRPAERVRHDVRVLVENLHGDSPAYRHAVRLAVAVPASAVLASWMGLPRGFWVPYAVAVILKPDYSTLFGRGVGRIIGTLLGATLAAVLVSGLHPDLALTTVLVGLTAWMAYSTWAASFPVGSAFVTATTLILLSTALPNPVSTAIDRLVDVMLGGAIAALAYLVWPTSPRGAVGDAESDLFGALRNYFDAIFDVVEAKPVPRASISACSRAARRAWAKAEAAVGQSIQEPAATRIDPSASRSLLAAALRIARASHALRIEAEQGTTVPPFDELDALGTGLLASLDALAHPSPDRPTNMAPDLRALYRAMETAGGNLGVPRSIELHLDELVNATNTATYLARLTELPAREETPTQIDPTAPGQ